MQQTKPGLNFMSRTKSANICFKQYYLLIYYKNSLKENVETSNHKKRGESEKPYE